MNLGGEIRLQLFIDTQIIWMNGYAVNATTNRSAGLRYASPISLSRRLACIASPGCVTEGEGRRGLPDLLNKSRSASAKRCGPIRSAAGAAGSFVDDSLHLGLRVRDDRVDGIVGV